MNTETITYRGTVYPWQCDHMGHMNVMWYAGKFDEASWQFLSILGITRSYLQARNYGLAAVQQNITYKRELRAGDIITIRSGILRVTDKTIQFVHEMENDETNEVAAAAELTGIYMSTVSRKACALPPEIKERAQKLVAANDKEFVTARFMELSSFPDRVVEPAF